MRIRKDEAQRLLEQYLEHVEHHRSPETSFAGRGVVVLDVMRYRLHMPGAPLEQEPIEQEPLEQEPLEAEPAEETAAL